MSGSGRLAGPVSQRAVLPHQLFKQRGRRPVGVPVGILQLADPLVDPGEALLLGVEHRATAPGREAVTEHVDHIDIPRTLGNALLQDPEAFINQCEDVPVDNLPITDRTTGNTHPGSLGLDHVEYFRVRATGTAFRIIAIVPGSGFLTQSAHLGKSIGDAVGPGSPFCSSVSAWRAL